MNGEVNRTGTEQIQRFTENVLAILDLGGELADRKGLLAPKSGLVDPGISASGRKSMPGAVRSSKAQIGAPGRSNRTGTEQNRGRRLLDPALIAAAMRAQVRQ